MNPPPLKEAAEALILAIRLRKPGGSIQFIPSSPGRPFGGNIAVQLFVDHGTLRRSALLAVPSAGKRLNGMPLDDVSSLLLGSLQTAFWRFMDRVLPELGGQRFATLWELSDQADVTALATEIETAISAIAAPKLWLVPGWRLSVDGCMDHEQWIIARGGSTSANSLDTMIPSSGLDGTLFPPISFSLRRHPVSDREAWLGVRARDRSQANSRFAALFGAISLALELPRSRIFSGEEFPDGLCSIDPVGRPTFSTRGPQFPPVLDGAKLSASHLNWIGRLLYDPARNSELQLRILTCLEYIAAGWQPTGRLGFVHNAIALDALFGIAGRVTKSIVAGVIANASSVQNVEPRIRALLKMRHALLHGSAPSVELTNDYIDYWDRYDADPHLDQIVILRTCIHTLNV